MKSKYITTILIALSLLVIVACGDDEANVDNKAKVKVSVVDVQYSETTEQLEFSGNVQGVESAKLSTKLMGTIVSFPFEVGNKVSKGQTIAKINSSDILAKKQQVQAGIAQAKAAHNNMSINFQRVKNLYEKGSATKKEMEDIQMAYDMAEAQLKAAQAMEDELTDVLNYSEIKSPFDGYIVNKFFDEGDLSAPGHPLMIVENFDAFKVVASISASEVNKIKKGDAVKVKLDELSGALLHGVISSVNQSAHPASRQYEVQILIEDENAKSNGLKSGMYAKIISDGSTNSTIILDESLIIKRGQLSGVLTVSQSGTALLRWIRLGNKIGNYYEVLSGLSVGDRVIKDVSNVQEGQRVEVI